MGNLRQFLLLLLPSLLLITAAAAAYVPLPSPILCDSKGCTVENYQGLWVDRKPCKASKAIYPTSEAELFEAVALASKTGSKVKVISKGAHSIPKLVCPGGEEGLLISTQFYNSFIHVNLTSLTVTAHAGVMLRDLLDKIAEYGLALPHTPYWQGISVAGMISTGAHGSSMWGKGSAPHDYVVGIRLIVPATEEEGYAKVIDLAEEDEDLDAARLSLGVLGAISMVTFQLEPMFKRSVTVEIRGDEGLEDEILQFAEEHEFGGLTWYPASRKALFKLDGRVSVETQGDGAFNMPPLKEMEVGHIESLRSALEASEERQNMNEICEAENAAVTFRHSSGDGLVNVGTTFTGYPVVGFNHKLQTSGGCEREASPTITPTRLDFNPPNEHHQQLKEDTFEQNLVLLETQKLLTCNWNPLIKKGFFFFNTAISIPTSRVRDAILEIKKLRDVDPQAICSVGVIGGIFMRFQTKSKAYLGEPTSSIMFDFLYYRSKEPHTPRSNQDVFEEIEQILVNKLGGKPHWGKNRDLVFDGMHTRTLAMDKFLEVMKKFDPLSLFSSEWSNAILGVGLSSHNVHTFQDHCALEGLCVCREDSHCHPTKGYYCRPGRVYKEARVCRYEKEDFYA
eukprot:c25216_g1_i1 orf=206-2071(-)